MNVPNLKDNTCSLSNFSRTQSASDLSKQQNKKNSLRGSKRSEGIGTDTYFRLRHNA
jgi:hypothetical protein